jgi:hypothetical protein
VVRDVRDAERKATLLADAEEALGDARLVGDLVVGAALSQVPDADPLTGSVAGEVGVLLDASGSEVDRAVARTALRDRAADWLVERSGGGGNGEVIVFADRRPLHWPLEFPEVSAQEGFDAIVGNPPFQGGKRITGALGTRYRDHLVHWVAGSVRGSADLVSYFFLRAAGILGSRGGFGLIATNTIAQGDTREVGLDRLVSGGLTLHRAVASEPWPGGANLEMAIVWASRSDWTGGSILDRALAVGITTSLTNRSRVVERAKRLASPVGHSHIGAFVNGIGFVLSESEAQELLESDPHNAEVVWPYLVGEDLNTRADGSPSRWIIDFRDWSLERAEQFPQCLQLVRERVKPVRDESADRAYRGLWWRFGRAQMSMRRAIAPLDRCIATARVSNVVQPMFASPSIVMSEQVVIFAYDDDAHFGLLLSGFHWWWVVTRASTLGAGVRYTPSDCFETFAQPTLTDDVATLGGALHAHRSALMLDRQEGLTKTYNRVHDPDEASDDIVHLRDLHTQLDHAVRDAYGWGDLELGHGFHDTRFGVRYTFEPVARQEVLDRLLELNHDRYADEVRRGLHDKKKAAKRAPAAAGALTLNVDG